jgi:hypothetical protein
MTTSTTPHRPGRIGVIVVYLIFLAVVVRMLAVEEIRPFLSRYLALSLVYILLYSLVLWRPTCRTLPHLYFAHPRSSHADILHAEFDFDPVFLLLSVQVSLCSTADALDLDWHSGLLTGGR